VGNNPIKFVDPDGYRLQIVFDFSETSLTVDQQVEIAAEIAERFRNAGVSEVRVHLSRPDKLPKDTKPWDKTITLKFLPGLIRRDPMIHGRRRDYPSAPGEVAMGAAPTSSANAMINFAINVGAHEGGHATRALTFYDNDGFPIGSGVNPVGAERNSIMEQGPSAEERGQELREFSNEDATQLRRYLNPPNPPNGVRQ
jgi:hypothetical protein